MIKAFLDTNVIYSALIKPGGAAALVLKMAAKGLFELYTSSAQLDELAAVVARPKALRELGRGYTRAALQEAVSLLSDGFASLGEVPETNIVENDPGDNHIVSAAAFGEVDYLVSGDKKHILPLKGHAGLRSLGLEIVSIGEFLEVLAKDVLPKKG